MCMVETQGLCLKVLLVLQRKWSGGEPTSVSPGLEASASEPLSLVVCKLAFGYCSLITWFQDKTNKTVYMLNSTADVIK